MALASALGGGHLGLPSLHGTQWYAGESPEGNQSVIRMENMDVGTCSRQNDRIDDLFIKNQPRNIFFL